MRLEEQYRIQEYIDLGILEQEKTVRLKRNKVYGTICVEKRVSRSLEPIYQYLKEQKICGIPEIYECIPDGEELLIIEQYIEGQTLEAVIREAEIPEDEAIRILDCLCETVANLHHANPVIICRDLKAENIMLDREKKVWIVDFNISRTYQDGKSRDTVLLGTVEYAAPEQFGFIQTDHRTDIYSLGVLLNYMISRKFPVDGIAEGKIENVIRKCTSIDPENRYQSVEELQKDLWKLCPKAYGNRKRKSQSFAIPGFRSKKLWKMAVAIFGYSLITWFCFTLDMESELVKLTPVVLKIEQSLLWISQMIFIAIAFDYRDCNAGKRWMGHPNKIIRVISCCVAECILLFLALFVCVFIENIMLYVC